MARYSLFALLVLCALSFVPSSLSQSTFTFTTQTSSGFIGRQQGGLLIVNTTGTTSTIAIIGSATPASVVPGALIIFGGQNGASSVNDVWFSTNGGQLLSSVSITASATYIAQSYGPATCVDSKQQILYSLAGDVSGDTAGTSQLYYSTNLGQSRTTARSLLAVCLAKFAHCV